MRRQADSSGSEDDEDADWLRPSAPGHDGRGDDDDDFGVSWLWHNEWYGSSLI